MLPRNLEPRVYRKRGRKVSTYKNEERNNIKIITIYTRISQYRGKHCKLFI